MNLTFEERIKLQNFYKNFYIFLYKTCKVGRIHVWNEYKETDVLGNKPWWLVFPPRKLCIRNKNLKIIVKFDTGKIGFEIKCEPNEFSYYKSTYRFISSAKKYYKKIDVYDLEYDEGNKSIFIYTKFEKIDINMPFEQQNERLVILCNAIFDFCWFARQNN